MPFKTFSLHQEISLAIRESRFLHAKLQKPMTKTTIPSSLRPLPLPLPYPSSRFILREQGILIPSQALLHLARKIQFISRHQPIK